MDKFKRIVALILAVLIVLSVASYLFYLLGKRKRLPLALPGKGEPVRAPGKACKGGGTTGAAPAAAGGRPQAKPAAAPASPGRAAPERQLKAEG